MSYVLTVALMSDAVFATGTGIPGAVDIDTDQDADGFPRISARRLLRLLADEGRELLSAVGSVAVGSSEQGAVERRLGTHERVFGRGGTAQGLDGILAVGDAVLPDEFRRHALWDTHDAAYPRRRSAQEVCEALTYVRQQTAVHRETGSAAEHTLRSVRAVLKSLWFEANLDWRVEPGEEDLAWVAVCALALRRVGLRRNRGRGRVTCRLHDRQSRADVTDTLAGSFLATLRASGEP
jgi:CRISPR-associated protein Csx10